MLFSLAHLLIITLSHLHYLTTMKTVHILILRIAVFFLLLSTLQKGIAQGNPTVIEAGVSEKLARDRKEQLKNVQYELRMQIPAVKSAPIPASEIISFDIVKNDKPVLIDFKEDPSHLKSISVNQKPAQINFQNEHIVIGAELLKPGMNSIAIEFIAGDLSLNRNDDYLYTLLVPDRARTVFPCFDQPDIKAVFKLSLTLPKNWLALSNAPLQDSLIATNDKTYNYSPSDKISTYLFSFAAGRFDRITKTVAGRKMNFFHRETDTSKIRLSVDSIFRIHGEALKFLESYTQIPFPFKKFDFIAIPDFQYGGMEHVGAIQYRAASLFLDAGATRDQENGRSSLIAHETSHMWFGDLVTMQWFNDVWMKEVFANFMADKITQGNQSNAAYDLKFLIDHYPAAYGVDRTAGANPIRQNLENLQDAGSLYGNIIYHKAPIMMRQLERLMGKDAFRDGLRVYLKKYQSANASWPDLIQILDAQTPADLQVWNKAWVNEAGRPVINYSMQEKDQHIARFTLNSTTENGLPYLLPQFFDISLVYPDRAEQVTINMNQQNMPVKQLEGKALPSYIIFNSTGQGYGLFPLDFPSLSSLTNIKDPVVRASVYINAYENMLSGNAVTPPDLLAFYQNILSKEPEELNLGLITRYVTDIFWRLIPASQRINSAVFLENQLWQTMQTEANANKKKILFRAFQNIGLSNDAKQRLYSIWKDQKPPLGVKLTEDDYTSLACTLALKEYHADSILIQQLTRITNPDRKKRLEFLMPSLSSSVAVRDAFFALLKDEKNREKESWVISALEYLHHPLRATTSVKYLGQTLDLLQEIQLTGDIFFPYSWLQSSFGSYQDAQAASIVNKFLEDHPQYNPKLKAKILQATDALLRAQKLVSGK
jgi:aminopeptidase N